MYPTLNDCGGNFEDIEYVVIEKYFTPPYHNIIVLNIIEEICSICRAFMYECARIPKQFIIDTAEKPTLNGNKL